MKDTPAMICINETFLDPSTGNIEIEGYVLIGRRDRQDGRKCGGIAVFVRIGLAENMTLVKISVVSERLWFLVHSGFGAISCRNVVSPSSAGRGGFYSKIQRRAGGT